MANGQCTAFRRQALVDAGGFTAAAGHLTDDIALVRALAARGWRSALLDGTAVLRVRMHTDVADAWTSWGRSLPMPDVTSAPWQVLDAITLVVAQALPLPRLLLGRGDALDLGLLALRLGTLAGTARAYEQTDLPYWLSPLADPAAVGAGALGRAPARAHLAGAHLPRLIRRRPASARHAAMANRSPMIDISAPVAATWDRGSKTAWITGRPKTPTRAPMAKLLVTRLTTTHTTTATADGSGASTSIAPTKVSTERPPRKPAKTGQAWPIMAAAPPRYPTHHGPPSTTPTAAACRAFGHVADEHRQGGAAAQRLLGVPVAGVADRRRGGRRPLGPEPPARQPGSSRAGSRRSR